QPEPQPKPQPEPQPEPQPKPQPEPQPKPQPKPQPAPQPAPPPSVIKPTLPILPFVATPISVGGAETDASIAAGALSDRYPRFRRSFNSQEAVRVLGEITPDSRHMNVAGDVFVVIQAELAEHGELWLYRDLDGNFLPWDQQLESLQPTFEDVTAE